MTTIMNRIVTIWAVLLGVFFLPANAMALNPERMVEGLTKVVTRSAPVITHSKVAMQLLSGIERAGGKALSKRAELLASDHGIDALHVLARDPKALVPALERFSSKDQAKLLGAFLRKPAFMDAYKQYGDDLLKLELRSKGQSLAFSRTFGAEGIALADKLTGKQLELMVLEINRFKHADKKIIQEFLELAGRYTGKTFDWIEHHPRLLYTGTVAALVMNLKTELLGNPETGTHGVVQQVADSAFGMLASMAPWFAGPLLLWGCFRSWLYRPKQQKPTDNQKKGWGSRIVRLFRKKFRRKYPEDLAGI